MTTLARGSLAVMVLLFVGGTGWSILSLPTQGDGLREEVAARLAESGAGNPVTAVLLNFRGYDTLLEIAVLLVAALAVRALAEERIQPDRALFDPPGPVLTGLLRVLAPLVVVVAGYLLWVGGDAPGGAFQAGAVLASLGVLILLCDPLMVPSMPDWIERMLLTLGAFVFVSVGLAGLTLQGALLRYPRDWAPSLLLLIEAACTLSIAMVLAALFAGGKVAPAAKVEPSTPRNDRP